MKEYIKGKRKIRLTSEPDGCIKIECFDRGLHATFFKPNYGYLNLVGFLMIKWLGIDQRKALYMLSQRKGNL